jgi:replicative DNA helicase
LAHRFIIFWRNWVRNLPLHPKKEQRKLSQLSTKIVEKLFFAPKIIFGVQIILYICCMEKREEKSIANRMKINAPVANIYAEAGKLPPQAIDLEEAVLGALMLEQNTLNDTIEILTPECFYKDAHQRIYQAIQDLFSTSEPVDILTVTNQLRKKGELELVGGAFYISNLTNRIASTAHVEYHARIILQKHIQREIIRMCSDVLKVAYDDTTDVFDLINKAESSLFEITQGNIKKNYQSMQEILATAIEEIEKAGKSEGGVNGVPTGFKDLDKITSGWQKSDMIVLAARPGMGKTAFVLSMARNTAVDYGMGVAVFSLEMTSIQLVNRLISAETGISSEKLRKGDLRNDEYQQLHSRISKLSKAPMYIDDTPGINIFDFRAKCRRLKAQKDIQLVIIDYLQLMSAGGSKNGNREQEISTISRSIKEIAKEINVPIIALSQLSRSVESRGGDKRPMLSDLRESGAIEQDADIVTFIYRPEYYGLSQDENGMSTNNMAQILIAKNRHGSLDTINLKFIKSLVKFTNMDDMDDNAPFDSGISPNRNFDGLPSNTSYTVKSSKMNNSEENDNFNFSRNEIEDEPF